LNLQYPIVQPRNSLAAATTRSALHALSLSDWNCWLGVGGCGSHALLDLAGHGQESLLYIGGTLCGGLEERNAEAVCELLLVLLDSEGDYRAACTYLCYGVLDDLLVRHIGLVTNQQLVNAFGSVTVNLLQPLLYVVERVHVGNIVDDADAVGAPVVRRCDGSETLLAGSIPL
jgi:hypothetical protein